MYIAASGTLSRRQLVSNIATYFSKKLLILHIEGCESVVGFKSSLGQFIKIAKKTNKRSYEDEIDKLERIIPNEVRATPRPGDYNLSDFAQHKSLRIPVLLFSN